MKYYGVFRKNGDSGEPLKIIKRYNLSNEMSAKKEAETCGYDKHEYNVCRLSKKWLREHTVYSVCWIALHS